MIIEHYYNYVANNDVVKMFVCATELRMDR